MFQEHFESVKELMGRMRRPLLDVNCRDFYAERFFFVCKSASSRFAGIHVISSTFSTWKLYRIQTKSAHIDWFIEFRRVDRDANKSFESAQRWLKKTMSRRFERVCAIYFLSSFASPAAIISAARNNPTGRFGLFDNLDMQWKIKSSANLPASSPVKPLSWSYASSFETSANSTSSSSQ